MGSVAVAMAWRWRGATALAWVFACVAPARAHELVSVRAISAETEVSQAARIGVVLTALENDSTECGLQVDYGDGTSEFVKVKGPRPSGVIEHVYRQAGTATVRIEGKTKFQGLFSTFACTGGMQVATVNVLPQGTLEKRAANAARKQAAEQSEREAAQVAVVRAQAETQAAQAEAQRQRLLAEQAQQRARDERANADRVRVAAERQTLARAQTTARTPEAPKEPAKAETKSKPEPAKAKSSLDL